jgi:hypothetical protein
MTTIAIHGLVLQLAGIASAVINPTGELHLSQLFNGD